MRKKFNKKPRKERTIASAHNVARKRAFQSQVKKNITSGFLLVAGAICSVAALGLSLYALAEVNVTRVLELDGRLQAIEQSLPVKHDIGGVVKELHITDGEIVKEGQILISLGTEDLETNYELAKRDVARNLIKLSCLEASLSESKKLEINPDLKRAMARMGQKDFMNRFLRNCEYELEDLELAKLSSENELKALRDKSSLAKRLSFVAQEIHTTAQQMAEQDLKKFDSLDRLLKSEDILSSAIAASEAQKNYEQFKLRLDRQNKAAKEKIRQEMDRIADALIEAEHSLGDIERLVKNRYIYASASGRVQRLRIKEAGGKIAAGAYVLEIAPLTTDFEVVATASVIDIPDVKIGATVQVKLSGANSREIWVPAQIASISKISANKRLVQILLKREDLNKRDLLYGDYTLNGLGEQSEAEILIKSEPAISALKTIISRQIFTELDI